MKTKNLSSLIGASESNTIEWKSSLSAVNEIIEAISAFANTEGGKIVIGISGTGKIVGTNIGKDAIENLTNQISQHTDPKIHPKIIVKNIDNKDIIIIDVKSSADKLTLAFGRPYIRIGKSTMKMAKDEYEARILEKHKDKLQFDKQINRNAKLTDINKETLSMFVRNAKLERGLDVDEKLETKEILSRLKLFQAGKLTNAAILLFGKKPQDLFLQATVKAIRFKGSDVSGEMIDFKTIEGNILSQLKKAEDFIFEHIPMRAWIENGKLQRQEKWLYPPKAIREALANALAHRDYELTGNTQVRIFDDRMEIWNSGILPKGLSVEQLRHDHYSMPRNPLIAKMFFWIKYAEEVGTGTNKIIQWCKQWGLPEPRFKETGASFTLTFKNPHPQKDLSVTRADLNQRQKKALEYIKEKGSISRKEFSVLTGISLRQANKDINNLLKKKLISRLGKGRSVKYTVHD
jgi:ATP-dependent DNA helicase RecG